MRVLVAGATGHLGRELLRAYSDAGHTVVALVRDPKGLARAGLTKYVSDVITADVTKAQALAGVCSGVDIVASALGITRQHGTLSVEDVDVGGNSNLLHAAEAAGVGHFQKIAANFRAEYYFKEDGVTPRVDVPILAAALKFEDYIRNHAKIPWTIIRSNGFFSDMKEVFEMARHGTVWGMGRAAARTNPIHQADVAEHFVKLALTPRNGLEKIGGPDVFTIAQIADEAFRALAIKGKFRRAPMWTVDVALSGMKMFSKSTYNIVSFLRLNMEYDEMIAPSIGTRHLAGFFQELARKSEAA